jgi:hypothetical protein
VSATIIAALTWPVGGLTPTNGLDPSWRIAMSMAVERGIDFGGIAFTYGPLGFLEVPINAEAHTLIPALAWIALLQVGLAYLIVVSARRTLGWIPALVLAYVACRLLDEGREVLPLVAFLWAALVLQWGVPPRLGRVLLPASGVLTGLGVLIKINEGVIALALFGAAAWWSGPRRFRALGEFAGVVIVTVVVAWVALGHSLGGLAGWVAASIEVARGYSAGLPFEDPELAWEYPLFIALVGGMGWFVWTSAEAPDRARRVALAAVGAVLAYSLFKHGFVRHDAGHSASTFVALVAVAAAFRWRPGRGRLVGGGVALATAAGALAVVGAHGPGPTIDHLDPRPRVEALGDHLRLAASPSRRAREREEARAALRDLHAIPPPIIAAVGDRPVHVGPYETSIVWAYGMEWRPVPVFQDYTVYTAPLDGRNADALRGDDGPERILLHGGPRIDGHSPEGEGPEARLAMLCGFRESASAEGWQVLARTPDRCGFERPLGSVAGADGATVAIPSPPHPDDLVVARLHAPPSFAQRLRTLLYKPREVPEVVLDDGYGFRVPADVASGPLLVRVPPSAGWSVYAPGFAFSRMRVTYAGPFRVEFAAIRLSAGAGSGGT